MVHRSSYVSKGLEKFVPQDVFIGTTVSSVLGGHNSTTSPPFLPPNTPVVDSMSSSRRLQMGILGPIKPGLRVMPLVLTLIKSLGGRILLQVGGDDLLDGLAQFFAVRILQSFRKVDEHNVHIFVLGHVDEL